MRVFISYKQNAEPDASLASDLFVALRKHRHKPFFAGVIPVSQDWGARIQKELAEADFLVALLTEESVASEMVEAEIATAHQLRKEPGRPVIVPVRVVYSDRLTYPLSGYLNRIQHVTWEGTADTPRLIEQLLVALSFGRSFASAS